MRKEEERTMEKEAYTSLAAHKRPLGGKDWDRAGWTDSQAGVRTDGWLKKEKRKRTFFSLTKEKERD